MTSILTSLFDDMRTVTLSTYVRIVHRTEYQQRVVNYFSICIITVYITILV